MNVLRKLETANTRGVRVATDSAALSNILEDDCAAVIWRRKYNPDLHIWLERLKPDQLPRGRVVVHVDDARDWISLTFDASQTPDSTERTMLVDDVNALVEAFARVVRPRFVRLRFDVVTTNACRRFHVDAVSVRLVCTYRGTGTQYGNGQDGDEPTVIQTVPTGDPILLRGTLWPEHPKTGLLHRSPPIEGTGETRLVLVLDAVSDPEEEV